MTGAGLGLKMKGPTNQACHQKHSRRRLSWLPPATSSVPSCGGLAQFNLLPLSLPVSPCSDLPAFF